MLTVHQLAVAIGAGYDRLFAAAVIGFSGLATAVAFVGFGYLSDRIGRRKTYVIGSVCLLMAIAILARLNTAEQASMVAGLCAAITGSRRGVAFILGNGRGQRSFSWPRFGLNKRRRRLCLWRWRSPFPMVRRAHF